MAYFRHPPRPNATNWFLTWDESSAHHGKSLSLQVKILNISFRDFLSDGVNSSTAVYRRSAFDKTWTHLGTTDIIRDDVNPEYPEAFRLCYDQQTDLTRDAIKVVVFNRRDTLGHEDVIGSASISMRELVRAFGTRVQVELIRRRDNRVVGTVWFIGEALPTCSPQNASDKLTFCIAAMPPRRIDIGFHTPRMFFTVARERQDNTWSVVYRSELLKKSTLSLHSITLSTLALSSKKGVLEFKPFTLQLGDLMLGMTMSRRVRFTFYQKGKHGDVHMVVGQVNTTVDELVNEFAQDTSLDVLVKGEIVGEFADIRRVDDKSCSSFSIELNYFAVHGDGQASQPWPE